MSAIMFTDMVGFSALAQHDAALNWLEQLYAGRDAQLTYLKVSPVLAELRDEPRFQVLLQKVGLA